MASRQASAFLLNGPGMARYREFMSSETLIPAPVHPGRTRSAILIRRLAAIIEVVLAFSLVHLGYRSFKHITALGRLEGATGLNFSPGMTMIVFTVAMLLVCRRNFPEYGLTWKDWRYNLNVGLLWAGIVVATAGLVLAVSPVRLDPLHPPDLPKALVCSCGAVVLTLLLALFLTREWNLVLAVPPAAALAVLLGLLSLPVVVAWYFNRLLPNVMLSVLWLFFGAGIGEEVFFRGYIQSRVNEAFGRPFTLLGVRFGPGLLVSSLLFGLIHALNTVDYFGGRYNFAWLWLLVNFFTGLFFGVLRERTGSVLAGAVVHGLDDVLGRIPSLLP
jgi:membrane protease YdiL (CAAX protease family)